MGKQGRAAFLDALTKAKRVHLKKLGDGIRFISIRSVENFDSYSGTHFELISSTIYP